MLSWQLLQDSAPWVSLLTDNAWRNCIKLKKQLHYSKSGTTSKTMLNQLHIGRTRVRWGLIVLGMMYGKYILSRYLALIKGMIELDSSRDNDSGSWEGAWFISVRALTILIKIFRVLLSPCRQMLGKYLKLSQNSFLPCPFQSIIQCHRTIWCNSLSSDSVVKQTTSKQSLW